MNNCKFVVCVIFTCLFAKTNGIYEEDYCWRDFDGSIPFDALKAGVDGYGKPIYIGQTLIINHLIPGRLTENVNKGININETVKILCTDYPERFVWFKTRLDQVANIKNTRIFEGGNEKYRYGTYVGRVTINKEVMIVKVTCSSDYICQKPTVKGWTDNFEILTYNETISKNMSSGYKSQEVVKLLFSIYFFLVLKTMVY